MASKSAYRKKIIDQMKELAIYSPHYSILIDTLAQTCEYRDKNISEWKKASKENGYTGLQMVIEYTNKAGATNIAKSPYYLNNLQFNEQILKYCKELGLSPSAITKLGGSPDGDKNDELIVFQNEFNE